MVRKSFMQSVALAVLAAASAFTALPAQAQDAEGQERNGRGGGHERRAEAQQQRQERQAAPAQAPQGGGREARQQPQAAPQGNGNWQARSQARQQERAAPAPQQQAAPAGGWRSQRPAEGQRYGRNWNNGGAVSRPAPAYNGATPQVPQRGTADQSRRYNGDRTGGQVATQRNRTYSDPNRTGSYGGRTNDRTAQDWRNQQGDRNGTTSTSTYRNGYRDGRSADNYRDRRDQNQSYRNGYASSSRDHRQWDRNDWRRDNRYNWSGYRNQHRDLFRAGRYYSPYNNYRYSRLSIGFFLDSGFYGQNYWIDDPYQYRLPEAYGPYRWVRYYDDALLVDIYSGEVVDVIHDFFW